MHGAMDNHRSENLISLVELKQKSHKRQPDRVDF